MTVSNLYVKHVSQSGGGVILCVGMLQDNAFGECYISAVLLARRSRVTHWQESVSAASLREQVRVTVAIIVHSPLRVAVHITSSI